MRFMLLLGVKPVPWNKKPEAERSRVKREIDAWFRDLATSGPLQEHFRFETWKDARTVTLSGGEATDAAGPLLVGPNKSPDSVLVGLAVIDASTMKAAVRIAGSWPVPDAAVEVRSLDGTAPSAKKPTAKKAKD